MSNKIYYNEMFNSEFKERFLAQFQKPTAETYKRIFLKSANIEEAFRTDLGNFNFNQLEEALFNLNPPTFNASRMNASIVAGYIDWAANEGIRDNNINPLRNIMTEKDWVDQFTSKNLDMYITESQLLDIEKYCVNAQDKIIARLIYEGVMGEGCSELLNLRKQDVGFISNTLKLTDLSGSERELIVSNACIELIRDAIEQERYLKKNGEYELGVAMGHGRVTPYFRLVENDYIIRSTITRTNAINSPADKHTVYRRINIIKDTIGVSGLTAKRLQVSGMLKMAKELLEKEKELGIEQYKKISERYGLGAENWFNRKSLVNEENINKIYYC